MQTPTDHHRHHHHDTTTDQRKQQNEIDMEYSKRIQELQTIYGTTPEGVFFAMLVAAGATRYEAYAIAFRPRTTRTAALGQLARELAAQNPGVNKLIDALQKVQPIADPTQKIEEPTKKRKGKSKEGRQFREKSQILDALCEEIPYLRGKDRIDALMKIADLQQMKKEETKEEEEKVIYYLPLRCNNCTLYQKSKAKTADL